MAVSRFRPLSFVVCCCSVTACFGRSNQLGLNRTNPNAINANPATNAIAAIGVLSITSSSPRLKLNYKTQRGVRTRSGEENIGCFIRFFAGARLGLVLATVSFAAAFPRAALAPFFFWTFDDYFLRLAIVGPRFWLALRKRIDARSRDNRPRVAATYPESYQQTFSAGRIDPALSSIVS
jgi:hypothetical protein